MDNTPSPAHRPAGLPRRLPGRTARLALLGGLAAGVGFAAVTGISAASGTGGRPTSANLSVAKAPKGAPTRRRGPWGPGGTAGYAGPGGAGTITAITARANGGDTLTVRTMRGTETVVTTTSTKVTGPDLQSTTLSSSDVGRVVRVITRPPAGSTAPGSATATPTRVDAVALRLVDPTVMGRVTAVGSNRYTLVGPDGQEITVTTSSSTRYVTGTAAGRPTTTTTAPGYAVGDLVFASGTETTAGTQSASTPTTTVDAVLMGKAPAGPGGPGRHGSGPLGERHGSGPLGGPWGPPGPGGAGNPGGSAPTAA
ncbi:MAG TPA: hypothetical protein VFN60_09570 [Acidimicrobiales bacterium]|nr:hypothetical protein [Acidimicrobiales bacterium]